MFKKPFLKSKEDLNSFTSKPQDIFICFSDRDELIALNVADAIENHGYSCWISTRNLSPSSAGNHWLEIKKAIKTSHIIVVISTQAAMLSKDVQNELDTAQEYGKRILEYKIDSAEHTPFFKTIFDNFNKPSEIHQGSGTIDSLLYRIQKELEQNKKSKNQWKAFKSLDNHRRHDSKPANPLLNDKTSNPMKIVSPLILILITIVVTSFLWMSSQNNLESINLSSTQVSLSIGETLKIDVEKFPEDAENVEFKWISNDTSIVTVDESGNLRAIGVGTTSVEVHVENIKSYVEVIVDEVVPEPIDPYLVSVEQIEEIYVDFGTTLEEVISMLPTMTVLFDNFDNDYEVDLDWIVYNYIGDDPRFSPARYIASGLFEVPNGIESGNVRTQVDTYVFLGIGLSGIDTIEDTQIPRGVSFEEALNFLDSSVTITDSIGNKEAVDISWVPPVNFSSDEIGTSFNLTGALILPDEISASEAFPANISTTVIIREPFIVNILDENISEVDVDFGTTLEGVISKLPDKLTLLDETQTEYEVDLNWVVYNYIGDDPQFAPARYVASGLFNLPEGVSRGSIRTQVDTYVNLGIGLAHVEEFKGFTVALGTSEQSILSRLDSDITITDSLGQTLVVDVIWSAPDDFDGNDYGETYLFTGIIDLPDHIGFSESMPAEAYIDVTIGMTDSDD